MSERAPLELEIRKRIKAAGPMPVREFMELCLTDPQHGYYATRNPLGVAGDFITAPEISQMFGELIGLWMGAVWKQMGAPENLRVIELGPGRGTMMRDALRAINVMPDFRNAIVLHLVEINSALMSQQEKTLEQVRVPVFWHSALEEVPQGPVIIVANEFFDALPVDQAVKTARGWHERQVGVDAEDNLAFTLAADPIALFERLLPPAVREAPEQSIFEWRNDRVAMEIGRRISSGGGAALVIDYGHAVSSPGETLQALSHHAFANPLTSPGKVDLTAHVDFQALARAIEAMGANSFGPIEQAQFLYSLGIEMRAAALKAKAPSDEAAAIDAAVARLTGRSSIAMGSLFKAAAFAHPQLGTPAGFEA